MGPVTYHHGHLMIHAPSVLRAALMVHPPITPSTVLFGEVSPSAEPTESEPNFVLPKFLPAKYAPTSANAMLNHVQNMTIAPWVIGSGTDAGTQAGRADTFRPIRSSTGAARGASLVCSRTPNCLTRTQKEGM
mmetsp:Transcript_25896/g.51596  ORF Transcript_25896/g.51596 Transcript_25896/m.51596 type:complete len:133 (+) Transcript_25896:435-833(+)